MGRIPFWAPVLPLLLGLLAYWLWWRVEASAFADAVSAHVPGASPETGGFPYRIEARLGAVRIEPDIPGIGFSAAAAHVVVNRQPWRTGHAVVAAEDARLDIAVPGLIGAVLGVEAPAMLASLRRPGDRLERLSMRFETAKVRLPLVAGGFDARDFELHLRELADTPAPVPDGASPTFPARAEARIAGTLARGDLAFGVSIPLYATAAARIVSAAQWRDGGTIEVKGAQVTGRDGAPLADIEATLAALPDGRIAVSGTVTSECPETVRALFAGRHAATEYRARRARAMALVGDSVDGFALGTPEGPSGGAARNREPPCPDLRR